MSSYLTKNSVDLWVISLSAIGAPQLSNLESYLSYKELAAVSSFSGKTLKENAIASRGCLKLVLSKYLRKAPALIFIDQNEYGKPHVLGSNIKFNVSHAGKYILIAVTRDIDIGVDIEQISEDFVFADIVNTFFTDTEKNAINSHVPSSRMAFYRAWTRKEACLKALGKGLSIDLQDVEVTCLAKEPAKVLKFKNYDNDWQLFDIDIDPQYFAALALQASERYTVNKIEFNVQNVGLIVSRIVPEEAIEIVF